MQSVYDLFLQRIAEGRKLPLDKIAPSAEGRVFGGVEAKERGLVDELGGFDDALKLARKLADLPDDTPFEIVGEPSGIFDFLDADEGGDEGESSRSEKVGRAVSAGAQQAAREALAPVWQDALPEVGAFLGSMAPLLQGEKALAALPYGLVIR
jgi:protease-4